MAQLYTLFFGTSKKRMKPIMTDVLGKVTTYKAQREKTKGSKAAKGWHKIEIAEPTSDKWRKKSATIGENRDDGGRSGYIGKNGFNPHT